MTKPIFISDFDGTITKDDFFKMVTDHLLTKADLQPWEEYKAGRKTHFDALNEIFAKIHLPQAEMDAFIASIHIDPYFQTTAELCKKLNIPFYICSAGTEYYVKKRLGAALEKYNITVYSNGGSYSPQTGLTMLPMPQDSPFYSREVGISKQAVVEHLKGENNFIIFAGDGRPDIKPARKADAVFAKSTLLKLCEEEGIKTLKFENFKNIFDYLGANYGTK